MGVLGRQLDDVVVVLLHSGGGEYGAQVLYHCDDGDPAENLHLFLPK